ncbi:hypothetical protein [Streptosporangium sp. NPDC051022]|uniref:hypothetical protein n=1 Tax=Streptosporangium sp. NPDC051022 TaxID=3155752 RepID=UPI0034191C07
MSDGNGALAGSVTLVVPCAGRGARFGAPYPKELHRTGPRGSVVDRALAPFLDWARRSEVRPRLVVPIAADRAATVAHLHRYTDVADFAFTFQAPRHGAGLAGAIRAGLDLAAGLTLLVLPDQYFGWDGKANPVDALARRGTDGVAVLAARLPRERLGDEGALAVEGVGSRRPTVARAKEKPADPTGYNAAWVAVAVPPARYGALVDLAEGRDPSPLLGAPVEWVEDYVNATSPGDVG